MAFIEMFFYCLNEVILVEELGITDIGGSILIHTFGAYFGLAFTRVMTDKNQIEKVSFIILNPFCKKWTKGSRTHGQQ